MWLVSLRGPIFTDRYLIWVAPAFYVLVGVGCTALRAFRRWLPLVVLVNVLVIGGVGLYEQAVLPVKPQFAPATHYLETHRSPDELVLFQIPHNRHVVSYYAEGTLDPWREAPYTNWRESDGNYQVGAPYVDGEMSVLTSGYDSVWLVYSEVWLWDDRALVKAWLDQHGQLADQRSYAGVELYRYDLDGANF